MKSKQEIEMDFERAISQAQELEQLSHNIRSLASENMSKTLRALSVNWAGENSERYYRHIDDVISEMFKVSDELKLVALNIRDIAQIVYKAEKAALVLKF